MNSVTLPGSTADVTPAIRKFLRNLDRSLVAAVASAAIQLLDEIDGDPDLEPDQDDMCAAGDDAGSGEHWLGCGDGLPGDPDDGEPVGDEQDSANAEDEILAIFQGPMVGPGCPVSDPAGCQEGYLRRPLYAIDQSLGPITPGTAQYNLRRAELRPST